MDRHFFVYPLILKEILEDFIIININIIENENEFVYVFEFVCVAALHSLLIASHAEFYEGKWGKGGVLYTGVFCMFAFTTLKMRYNYDDTTLRLQLLFHVTILRLFMMDLI